MNRLFKFYASHNWINHQRTNDNEIGMYRNLVEAERYTVARRF